MNKFSAVLFLGFLGLFSACNKQAEQSKNVDYLFHLLPASQTGIDFQNSIISSPGLNILSYLYFYNGAGVAAGDFNNNGFPDLYFISNMGENAFYINKGNLEFENVTSQSGLEDADGWSTGVTTVDINNDGLLDIYVCKVGNFNSLQGKNKLYVNQGINQNGVPVFKEEAAKYNLDIVSFSTQAVFFDYDLDGDLDMFLLNHSVHPNSNYGRGSLRNVPDSLSGDRLYRNNNEIFEDVSAAAGIFQGKIGYGLGVAISDINNNGYPDIYVGNDFFENDYLYINQKDGTFREIISTKNGGINHTSHFSMGVDIADINNDGYTDILTLDMLPEDLTTYKASGTDYSYNINRQYIKNNYAHQYMQNALQLNLGDTKFSEIGHLAGIAATEWSWAPLIADFDNNGLKDIFISNGIPGATNDMDFISFIANEAIQKELSKGVSQENMKFIEMIPEKKTNNYFFRNINGIQFENTSSKWSNAPDSFSNGAIYVDLDNDGDLDVVVNNINDKAFIYENKSNEKENRNYLKINFRGSEFNKMGIGAKVKIFTEGKIQIMENYSTRGYLSSVIPGLHFGLGSINTIDSLEVQWPDGTGEVLYSLKGSDTYLLDHTNALKIDRKIPDQNKWVEKGTLNIPYAHLEYETKDFNIEPLAPYAISNEGPALSVLDFNRDGLQDLYASGSKFNPGKLFLQQKEGSFKVMAQPGLSENTQNEPVGQLFFDVNNNGLLDLVIVYGGNELQDKKNSAPALYININNTLTYQPGAFPNNGINASVVVAGDFNKDGHMDIFIGSNSTFGNYGQSAENFIFINDGKGNFTDQTDRLAPGLKNIGLVYDAKVIDITKNGFQDLILAGHYMPITIFVNQGTGKFKQEEVTDSSGWWNTLEVADFDGNGQLDIVAGNWGLNSRLQASVKEPIQLYLQDFDNNKKIDPIVTYYYQGRETPIATRDELAVQIPMLKKKFLSYSSFAESDFKDYFTEEKINSAIKKKVVTLQSTYFRNNGNLNFDALPLPLEAQVSPIHSIIAYDITGNGNLDLLLGGNSYEVNTQLGRQDASYSQILFNNGKGNFTVAPQREFYIHGAVRSIVPIKIKEENHILFGINNDSLQIIKALNE